MCRFLFTLLLLITSLLLLFNDLSATSSHSMVLITHYSLLPGLDTRSYIPFWDYSRLFQGNFHGVTESVSVQGLTVFRPGHGTVATQLGAFKGRFGGLFARIDAQLYLLRLLFQTLSSRIRFSAAQSAMIVPALKVLARAVVMICLPLHQQVT